MLSGFRSRCTMPASCAAARPDAICTAKSSAWSRGSGPRAKQLGQRLTLDELQHQVAPALRLLDPVDPGDVGVAQRRERARLGLEAREAVRVARQILGQRLQRDGTAEPRVRRPVDDAHAPATDLTLDPVWTDFLHHGSQSS